MRAHAEEGDVAGALRIYKALWDLLDRDYGMEPSPQTEELVANIKLGVFDRAPADRGVSAANDEFARPDGQGSGSAALCVRRRPSAQCARPRRAWCCGPLRCMASTTITAIWCRGSRSILPPVSCVSGNGAWSIVLPAARRASCARSSAPQYCIETTAYQAGAEINIVMVLRDDTTGIYVWSESFRLGLGNWFETQQRIIRRIATSLNVQLSTERLMRLAGEPDVSLDLHDRWLRGQSLHGEVRCGKLAAGRRHLPRCDPRKSRLLALLQQPRADEQHRASGASRASFAISKRPRRRSNWRKPPFNSIRSIRRAHLCCGWSYVMALREAEAAPHMELACELNDNDPWTLALGRALLGPLRIDRAGPVSRRASRWRCPPRPRYLEWAYHSTVRFFCGDYAGAIEACDRAQGVIQDLAGMARGSAVPARGA